MHRPRLRTVVVIGISILSIWALVVLMNTHVLFDSLYNYSATHRITGAIILAVLMCAATVFAPLTVLPIVPIVAPILGPFTTGLAAYIGWTLGSIIGFWIARRYGQPIVLKIVEEESLERIHRYIKPEMSFVFVLALRLIVPADILSYALGLFTKISYRVYIPATMIGLAWFSFAFAYLGESAFSQNYVLLGAIGVASVILLYIISRYIKSK